jgi:hypothetical protein
MFKLLQDPQFTHEVAATVPVDGGYETQKFKVTFRVLDPVIAEKFDINTTEGSTGFLRAAVAGLSDITDEDGNEQLFSDKVLESVLRLPYARVAMARGYFDAIAATRTTN